ncbi:unnamed protein product [Rotaria socialis]|uniref:Death domain-containing protein n=1 Tax=Rotaria socialis TaxID=392032 RepID=A0A821P1F9_9BILA|nr:unnamed protein product [Rotaria socialis]CAF4794861.1 unnamed protein product [Rotaria socialis]
MEELIRQLTHDNQQFEEQWPTLHTQLHELSVDRSEIDSVIVKVKSLDALVDYILADTEKFLHVKLVLAENVIKHVIENPTPPFDELTRIFCRVLDVSNTNNLFNLSFLEKFLYVTRIGEELSKIPSVNLIDSIFNHLEKHEFSNQNFDDKMKQSWRQFLSEGLLSPLSMDVNKLNSEATMNNMRSSFQRLYRCAALNSHQSDVWSAVLNVLNRGYPTLFNSYTDSEEATFYLTSCAEPTISADYVHLISQGYKNDAELFKTNISLLCTIMEKLVLQNRVDACRYFMNNTLIIHFKLITNFEELLQMLIRMCSSVNIESRNSFCTSVISLITYELSRKKCKKELAGLFFDFILAILNFTTVDAPQFAHYILAIGEFYPWKQLDTKITQLIQSCITYDNIACDARNTDLDYLNQILSTIRERAKGNPTILHATHTLALEAVLKWSSVINNDTGKPYSRHVFGMGVVMVDLVDQKQVSVETCSKLLGIFRKLIDPDDEIFELNQLYDNFLRSLVKLLAESLAHLKTLPLTLHEEIASFILAALNHPFMKENGAMTLAHDASLPLWFKLGVCMHTEDDARPYKTCADRLYQLAFEDEAQQQFHPWWLTFWTIVGLKYPNLALDHISQFLEEIIDRKRFTLLSIVTTLYSKRPEPFHSRLNDLIHGLFDASNQRLQPISFLVHTIVQAHPELITSEHVDYLFALIKDNISSFDAILHIFLTLGHIASAQPHLFDKHKDTLFDYTIERNSTAVFDCLQRYLVASTIINGETTADEYLTQLINLIKSIKNIAIELKTQIFHTCQVIGVRHKHILAAKRNDLIPFESDSTCQALIGFIDGNILSEENQAMIDRTLDEIVQIEKRVVHTEQDIQNITKVVKHQELNITNLNSHVNEIDTRNVSILGYVPTEWGRDVCTLLNVRTENDWRLLGKRFGYSTSELKHWAMQIDPSMSLLNEWFMTHKADEATYGLLKILNDIGRTDAEDIIRKAVTKAGQLIPDDMSIEIKRLPPVFISYQWGSQKAVLRLKSNLEQAGYLCWMDTGQMGGGDKLFAKLDAGIRGAKVIICCMNKAYAQSDNCSREVHLTVSTGKTLIPLQMEKQTWPPEGALGPIMSEYLFIRFFDRNANDENYWPADKFTELLGQIRYHVAPDPDMISGQYHNWFVPRIDNLIFLQPQTSNDSKDKTIVQDNIPLVVTHPQIMISYQWDYQNDIVHLYEKLTKLGYRCWLDIFQMGGGDSLFEKIDTGVRNAKCILACVTPKYTKSINCRREMALSDALKRPIIPLLLEETSTWPPEGPMAMVFSEKPFIDFRRATDDSERWTGKEFESVLARLQQIIPEVQTEKPQRYLIDMQRPTTATKEQDKKSKRIRSAPVTPQSRACSIM